jgi:hypothetical protein
MKAAERVIVFGAGNRLAAELILANVERYGGETAALVQWARRVLDGRRDGRR